MKNWLLKSALIFGFLLLASVLLGTGAAYAFQFYECTNAARRIAAAPTIKPAQFFVYGSSLGTVSCRFGLYDEFGREIATIERSWNGNELYLDFALAKFGGTNVLFPLRLYTESTEEGGVELVRYYLKDGVCRIYTDVGADEQKKSDFARLCVFASSASKNPLLKSNAEIRTVRLTAYETARTASVYTTSDGRVVVVQ